MRGTSYGYVSKPTFHIRRDRVQRMWPDQEYRAVVADNERLRKGIQDYLDGDYEPRIKKMEKCPHGLYGYECCENCIDEHFVKLLNPTP